LTKSAQHRSYLTPKEVAAELMVTPETVRLWEQKGLLPAELTLGGHRRFKREDIDAFSRRRSGRAPGSPVRILIVDDEAQITAMLVELFDVDELPIVSACANSGFDAGQKIMSFDPDVVLLDLMMPGVNGIEVCKQIMADKKRNIRVIGITGYHIREKIDGMLSAGAIACLAKPLNLDELLSLIHENARI
jgi:excisionase family DNA binding protein